MPPFAFSSSLTAFFVSLLVGGFGIYAGARLILSEGSFVKAVVTALVGALVWGVVSLFVGWIPLVGPVLTFLAWMGVVKGRYGVGWIEASLVALVAWISSVFALYVLSALSIGRLSAVGIPGV
ncbi:MAG: hypothetical protein SV253_02860 [Halobacteria archaeon]|nr:hypothetical protein [Halobacteria archaeon]